MEDVSIPRVLRIRAGTCHVHLLVNGDKSVLIDAGNKGKEEIVLSAIRIAGLHPSDISLIILTHAHYDHCGCLKYLKEATGAKLMVHKSEWDIVASGFHEIPTGAVFLTRILSQLGRRYNRGLTVYPPVKPDIAVDGIYSLDGYGINGYILPTPGHTTGSVSVILANGIAIVGDAMIGGKFKTIFPIFAEDIPGVYKSWEKLIATGSKLFYPAHSGIVTLKTLKQASERTKKKIEGI